LPYRPYYAIESSIYCGYWTCSVVSKIAKAIKLSKITMRGIKQNLFWAFVFNVVGIPLAAGLFYPIFGWFLSPVFAGMAMAMSSVSVVGNSLRIKSNKL
jgi:cation transport ATPase